MKYINVIESFYPSLSKQEKKVASYILEEKGKISYQSLQEIAKRISVGEATIVRFVKKIGFNGFQDLKINIAKEDFPIIETKYEDYIDNIQANITSTVANTKLLIDRKQLDKAIGAIGKAERIFLYGIGSSGIAVEELQNRLLRFGKTTVANRDTHFQVMSAAIMNPKDVAIAVTLSGTTPDMVEILTIAKNSKCKIIVITNHILSPAAQLADYVLLTAGRETLLDGGSLTAKMSQLYMIDVLCTGYALKNKEKSLKMKHHTAKAIGKKNKSSK